METISQALKDAAIKYTRKNWHLLPIEPKAKKPVWHDWGNKPVTDPTTAEMIWMTDYNIGVHLGPKGGIIDIECDEDGSCDEYAALFDGNPPLVPSYRSSRGPHFLFEWREGLPPQSNFHAGKLEIRCGNGDRAAQSVLPPSIHPDGATYQWIVSPEDTELGKLPDKVIDRLVSKFKALDKAADRAAKVKNESGQTHEDAREAIGVPLDDRIARARAYLDATPGTQQGEKADNACFNLCMKMLWGFALPIEDAQLLLEDWGEKESNRDVHGGYYPWSSKEIAHKLRDAANKEYDGFVGDKVIDPLRITGEQAEKVEAIVGSDNGSVFTPTATAATTATSTAPKPEPIADPGETPEEMAQRINAAAGRKPQTRPRLRRWSDLKAIAATQKEDWLIDKWAEFGTLLCHTSLPFGGKSTIWAWIMASIAKNEPWAGLETQSVPIVLFDFENKERILVSRIQKYLRGDEGRLEELLYAVDHTTIEYPLTDTAIAGILDAIQPAIEAAGGKCLVLIDTLRSAFVGEDYDERDESSMVRLLRPLQRLAKKYNACVVVLHHNAKYSNAYSGSTAIAAVADTLWNWKSDKIALTG